MNLVQINERLKDLPMQVIQQYANGMNPEVPPYLALGELQRRESTEKQAAATQGGAQGPQASIKEQLEQKAGLMALQQAQQQQMQPQQPSGPMPVPAGIPQPQAQPQAMMARGGLAGIPVRRDMFEYAGGGIIAFQAGGDVAEKYKRETAEMGEGKRMQFSPDVQAYAKQLLAAANAEQDAYMKKEQERQLAGSPMMNQQPPKANEVGTRRYSSISGGKGYDLPSDLRPATVENVFYDKEGVLQGRPTAMSDENFNRERLAKARTEQLPTSQGPGDRFAPRYPQSGLPAAAKDKAIAASGAKPPSAPRPVDTRSIATPSAAPPAAAPQPGLPEALAGSPAAAAIPVSPDRAELDALMKAQQRPAPTAKGVISDVNALMPTGMQEAAREKLLADQRARVEARQAAYEKSKPSGLDDLIRVFGQAGQYKGLSGTGPAYTAMQQQRRAEDLAMQKQQDELLTAIEGRGAAFDKDVFTARTGTMDKAQTMYGQSQKSILEAAAAKLGAEQGRLDKQAQLNMQRDLEQFKAIQDKELKGMDIGQRKLEMEQRERESKRTDARSPAAKAAEYVALKQKARDLRAKGEMAQADRLDSQATDMLAFGGSGNAGVGATRNAISERRLEMVGLEKIMKDESGSYSEEERKEAAKEYRRLALLNSKESGGAPSGEVDKTNPLLK
jgi:hypothetical protein